MDLGLALLLVVSSIALPVSEVTVLASVVGVPNVVGRAELVPEEEGISFPVLPLLQLSPHVAPKSILLSRPFRPVRWSLMSLNANAAELLAVTHAFAHALYRPVRLCALAPAIPAVTILDPLLIPLLRLPEMAWATGMMACALLVVTTIMCT